MRMREGSQSFYYARSTLFAGPALLVRWLQIVIVRETQFDERPLELWRQRGKRIRRANRGKRRPVQRLLARTIHLHRHAIRHRAVLHNLELQRHHTLFPKAHRRWHHRLPISFHDVVHPAEVVVEIHALGVREHFDSGAVTPSSSTTSAAGKRGSTPTTVRDRRVRLRPSRRVADHVSRRTRLR